MYAQFSLYSSSRFFDIHFLIYNLSLTKQIPNWARSVNLVAALEKQYSTGPDCIDPDTIFPEVESCNLEEIFDQRKTRFVRRTSSGNWTNDKVTTMEKLTYKRNMGFKGT